MESPQNEASTSTSHPLKNHVILKHIFDYLKCTGSFQDWQNIRQVCKLWYEIFLPIWRNNAVLSLVRDNCILETPLEKRISVSQFLAELQNPASPHKLLEIPFRKYKFQNMKIDLRYCKPGMPAHTFWSLIGPSVKELTLQNANLITGTNSMSIVMQFLVREMPYLTTLNMTDVLIDNFRSRLLWRNSVTDQHLSVTSISCKNVEGFRCSMFPNLQKACFSNANQAEILNFMAESGYFPNIVGTLTNSSLKHLDLINSLIHYEALQRHLPNLSLTALEHFSINLQTIRIDPHDNQPDNTIDFIPVFLRNHHKTLKCLEVFSAISNLPTDHILFSIKLPVLTKLKLWGKVVNNLGFLQFTPNLTQLHLDVYGFEKQTEMKKKLQYDFLHRGVFQVAYDIVGVTRNLGSLTGVVLKKLEYLQISYKLSIEDVRTLSRWMPHLKVFKSVLKSDNFSAVCEQWPQMEELHCLFGSDIRDENIIGGQQVKGLIDLKQLTRFHYNTRCNKSVLTDVSARQILRHMKKLIYLNICVSREFTNLAERTLKRYIQRVRICRNYRENARHQDWICCRDNSYKSYLNIHQENLDRDYLFSQSESDGSDSD